MQLSLSRTSSVLGRWVQFWQLVVLEVWQRRTLLFQLATIQLMLAAGVVLATSLPLAFWQQRLGLFGGGLIAELVSLVVLIATLYVIMAPAGVRTLRQGLLWEVTHAPLVLMFFVLWVGLLCVGSLLFLIPAIALLGYGLFSVVVLIEEKERGVMTVVRSIELIRGAWWSVTGRFVCMLVSVLLLTVGSLFILSQLMTVTLVVSSVTWSLLFLFFSVAIAVLAEAVMILVVLITIRQLYEERLPVAEPLTEGAVVRLRAAIRTAAYVGWVIPLVLVMTGAMLVQQNPELFYRALLYITAGV